MRPTHEPLLDDETAPNYGTRHVEQRMRALRIVILGFVAAIVVGGVLTTNRLAQVANSQNYVDANFPACRKGYALATYAGASAHGGGEKLVVWSGKADANCAANELCDDLWSFDADLASPMNGTSKWTRLSKPAQLRDTPLPEARWKTVAMQDADENMYIFAGDPLRENGTYIRDVWKLNAPSMEWERLEVTCGEMPSKGSSEDPCSSLDRRAHAAVMIGHVMYVHGGKDPLSDLLNDVWQLDMHKLVWRRLHNGSHSDVRQGAAPIARKGHSLVAVEGIYSKVSGTRLPGIVLFGGRVNYKKYFNDVWAFFPKERRWELLGAAVDGVSTQPDAPHPRDHHAAAVIGNGMHMFGGWYQYWHAFDDVWRFDLDEHKWTAHAAEGVRPAGRFLVSIVPIGKELYLFGGERGSDEGTNKNEYMNDVWAFDTESSTWTQLAHTRCPRDHSVRTRVPRVIDDDDQDDGESR